MKKISTISRPIIYNVLVAYLFAGAAVIWMSIDASAHVANATLITTEAVWLSTTRVYKADRQAEAALAFAEKKCLHRR